MKRPVEYALRLALLVGTGAAAAFAQTQEAPKTLAPNGGASSFEAASIRPIGAEVLREYAAKGYAGVIPCNGMFELTPGRIRITAATVFRLVATAYGQPCAAAVNLKLIAGGPDWLQKEAFHIQATLPAGTPTYTLQQLENNEAPLLQAMLRNLLAERFRLIVSRATKEVSTYNIYSGKDVKMTPSADQTPTQISLQSGTRGNYDMMMDRERGVVRMRATAIPMSRLTTPMQGRDGRMVIDRTGMTGVYDIPPMAIDVGPSAPGVSVWPEILRALGFRVESARGPVDFLTVERIERPTEN